MTAAASRVVMIVANAVDGDSRVQKIASSMADRGYDVVLVGTAPSPTRDERALGKATVIRVPVRPVLSSRFARRPDPGYRSARALLRHWDATEADWRWEHRTPDTSRARSAGLAWRRRQRGATATVARRWGSAPLPSSAMAIARRVAALAGGLLDRNGGWRQLNPYVQDLELAVGPVLDELDPDLIHAHDFHTVGIAARAAARLSRPGRPVRWVYDAHEYLAGTRPSGATDVRGRLRHRFFLGQEREFAPSADAVVTVSEPIAQLLRRDLRLRERPRVVRNVPPRPAETGRAPSLRAAVGVAADVPLLVYSGSCAPQRGVATLVEALPQLPGVHAVLVAAAADRFVAGLIDRAARLGCVDRLHVAPYVAPELVPAYLAEADAGVTPLLHRPNHELSLNTKYAEYVHAGLPVIVSDVRTMAAYTREHGLGEVFTAGDPGSLAAAARRVLAAADSYRAAYARQPRLLDTLSWDRQVDVLDEVYRAVLGHAPGVVAPSDGEPAAKIPDTSDRGAGQVRHHPRSGGSAPVPRGP